MQHEIRGEHNHEVIPGSENEIMGVHSGEVILGSNNRITQKSSDTNDDGTTEEWRGGPSESIPNGQYNL